MTSSLLSKLKSANQKPIMKPLMACVMGVQGSGKSGALGTLGVPTLILRTPVEHHGATAARTVSRALFGKDLISELDIFEGAKSADEVHAQVIELLADKDLIKQFKAVAIDSVTDYQVSVIRHTARWKEDCTSQNGRHNKLAETGADQKFFAELMSAMLAANMNGLHCFVTMAAQMVQGSDDGTEIVAKPALQGVGPAALINRSCPDVFLVSRTEKEDGQGHEHTFLFNQVLNKESKNLQGQVTKTENFNCRISYVPTDELPLRTAARFDEVIAIREQFFNKGTK